MIAIFLALDFGVPVGMMNVRLKELDLINENREIKSFNFWKRFLRS